jgi:hypothetical protein
MAEINFHKEMWWKNKEKNLIAISRKFGYSCFIPIQNFELLVELKVLSSLCPTLIQ